MCLKIRSWGVFVFFCFISSYKVFSQGTCDFGNLRSYNVISNTGATIWNSDIEGTSAYGGNLQSGNFSYGQTLPANSSPALQVQGDITVPGASNNIQVFNGNVTITGNVNGGGSVITNGYALQTGQPSIPLNIPSAFTLLQNRAST